MQRLWKRQVNTALKPYSDSKILYISFPKTISKLAGSSFYQYHLNNSRPPPPKIGNSWRHRHRLFWASIMAVQDLIDSDLLPFRAWYFFPGDWWPPLLECALFALYSDWFEHVKLGPIWQRPWFLFYIFFFFFGPKHFSRESQESDSVEAYTMPVRKVFIGRGRCRSSMWACLTVTDSGKLEFRTEINLSPRCGWMRDVVHRLLTIWTASKADERSESSIWQVIKTASYLPFASDWKAVLKKQLTWSSSVPKAVRAESSNHPRNQAWNGDSEVASLFTLVGSDFEVKDVHNDRLIAVPRKPGRCAANRLRGWISLFRICACFPQKAGAGAISFIIRKQRQALDNFMLVKIPWLGRL